MLQAKALARRQRLRHPRQRQWRFSTFHQHVHRRYWPTCHCRNCGEMQLTHARLQRSRQNYQEEKRPSYLPIVQRLQGRCYRCGKPIIPCGPRGPTTAASPRRPIILNQLELELIYYNKRYSPKTGETFL
jgi:hypothetical protein